MTFKNSLLYILCVLQAKGKVLGTCREVNLAVVRVTWLGFPSCCLAGIPVQDVPSCSHRAHRWLEPVFKMAPPYSLNCKSPWRVPIPSTVDPLPASFISSVCFAARDNLRLSPHRGLLCPEDRNAWVLMPKWL